MIDTKESVAPGNPLKTEKIPKLMAKFAIPSIIAMLVNSLYNIVDQIFIGQGIGKNGNAATTLSFPFVTLSLAISLLIGAGCAAVYSLKLGQGNKEHAARSVGNALVVLAIISVVFLVLGQLFLRPLLVLFGGSEGNPDSLATLNYAVEYSRVILFGLPFAMLGTALSHMIRADGSPRYSMVFMVIGAVLNTVLDPIFIFVFHWGMQGAAYATIIGQILSFVFAACYLKRYRCVKLNRSHFRLNLSVIGMVLALGMSYFITQMSFFVTQLVLNNVIKTYGAASIYGDTTPLAAMGIVMKVNQILMSILIGIAQGSQPIIGFNYGAKQYGRVRQTYLIGASIATVISVCGEAAFLFGSTGIMNLFGKESDPHYLEFANRCFRIFLAAVFTAGFQVVTSNFCQAIGKPMKSAILSLSRQIGFLVPLLLILPIFWGLDGMLYAGPIADSLAAVLAVVFIIYELKQLRALESA